MNPTPFAEATKTLAKPTTWDDETDGHCGPLPVFSDGSHCISRWVPSWRERLAVLFGRPVWVFVASGWTQPPIALSATRTVFTTLPPPEPILERPGPTPPVYPLSEALARAADTKG